MSSTEFPERVIKSRSGVGIQDYHEDADMIEDWFLINTDTNAEEVIEAAAPNSLHHCNHRHQRYDEGHNRNTFERTRRNI